MNLEFFVGSMFGFFVGFLVVMIRDKREKNKKIKVNSCTGDHIFAEYTGKTTRRFERGVIYKALGPDLDGRIHVLDNCDGCETCYFSDYWRQGYEKFKIVNPIT